MFASCTVLLIFVFTTNDAARILAVFPAPSISHQVVFRPLTQELAKRGHDVVVITPDPVFPKGQAPVNLTEIDVHDLSYSVWKRFYEISGGSTDNWLSKVETIFNLLSIVFKEQMKAKVVQDSLFDKNIQFDLLLAEACVRPVLGLSYVFKVPTILVSSLGSTTNEYEVLGAPSHPFLYPILLRDRFYNLTMWEKLVQLNKEINYKILLQSTEEKENALMKQLFGPETPTLNILYNNVEMFFANVHPIWEENRPVPPNFVYMGGLHQNKPKILPEDLQSYLNSSKNGVIYISFGTNVKPSLLPLDKIEAMIRVFSRLPYDVLWKWDKDELPLSSPNIKISKWLPQSDLLRHPKIKLFITQGGLQSTDEAIMAVVPLIGIPMLGDQWYNVEKYVRHKIGLRLDLDNLNEEIFEDAVKTVIQDTSYRKNVARLREIMMDQPQSALERAVWWTEHVLRHGGARHLRPPTANMSWADYLEWKLVCFLATLTTLSLITLYALVSTIWKFAVNYVFQSAKFKMS